MHSRTPPLLTAWILWSSACAVTGWTLALTGNLGTRGYVVAVLVGVALVMAARGWLPKTAGQRSVPWRFRWRRFRRPAPLIFAVLAGGALVGGLIYAPNNYDALTYRVPRMLHWFAEGAWYWVKTPNYRVNIAAADSEWLLAPLYAFTHSDRLFFLPNFLSYLLLPGLVFSVFRLAGVRPRVAWFWMWLFPGGLCFVMQAGSIGNDLLAAVYALAALHYALRAREAGSVRHVWLAVLCAGLLTGSKVSNLPLLLPWAVAIWPALRVVRQQFAAAFAVCLVAAMVSFLPTAVLNHLHTGHWGGDPGNIANVQLKNPLVGLLGNGLLLAAQGTAPPLLPGAQKLEEWLYARLPAGVDQFIRRGYPRFDLGLSDIAKEEGAGLGFGVTIMALGSAVLALRRRQSGSRPAGSPGLWIGIAAWIAFAAYLGKMGSEATARLLAPYYAVVLIPLLLLPGQALLVRRRAWRGLALLAAASALCSLVLTPSRPLFPALTLIQRWASAWPGRPAIERVQRVYTVYRQRNDCLAPVCAHLPPQTREIGVAMTEDDSEMSLWRPFGSRRIRHLNEADLAHGGLPGPAWVIVRVNPLVLAQPTVEYLQRVISPSGGKIIAVERFAVKASHEPDQWAVVHFPAAAALGK